MIRRGAVFNISFTTRRGHEQQGLRPAIIIQADLYCPLSTILVIPTSKSAHREIDFHVPVTIKGTRTYALIEQLTAVDKTRRIIESNYLGMISPHELKHIDDVLMIFVGLYPEISMS
jgi:mRNA interferase MazF